MWVRVSSAEAPPAPQRHPSTALAVAIITELYDSGMIVTAQIRSRLALDTGGGTPMGAAGTSAGSLDSAMQGIAPLGMT